MTTHQDDRIAELLGTPQQRVEAFRFARFHVMLGWWLLLFFLSLGVVLEVMHGLKIGWYLSEETRRMLWTLAHAHGTLLAIVHIVFGTTVATFPQWSTSSRSLASRALLGAAVLIPGGFFLGGFFFVGGDPGLGILVLPAGALLLFLAVLYTARAISKVRYDEAPTKQAK